jgi:three-Cys-motif partner protein
LANRSSTIARPGGAQTRVKLGIVGDYLKRFARASSSAPDRIYIDGLAGSGTGIDPRTGETYDGSARLPFDVEPPFTEVYLIEMDKARAAELEKIADEHKGAKAICGT